MTDTIQGGPERVWPKASTQEGQTAPPAHPPVPEPSTSVPFRAAGQFASAVGEGGTPFWPDGRQFYGDGCEE